jgi:hypothetical protein
MSLIATAAGASASPIVNLLTHGHKKGSHAGGKDGTANSSTQGPATTQSLLSSLFESIQQVIGISVTAPSAAVPAAGAVTAATGAGATPSATVAASAAPGSAQDVQGFLHSLFQALKADGLGASAGATASSTASAVAGAVPATGIGAGAASGAGRYDGSLVSSLQTLIHQVNSNGPATAATSNLSASFNTLIQGAHGSAAVADAGGSASLQNFLGNLLQSVQSSGIHSFSGMGANVNAKV